MERQYSRKSALVSKGLRTAIQWDWMWRGMKLLARKGWGRTSSCSVMPQKSTSPHSSTRSKRFFQGLTGAKKV